jgi:hypothetical protein
LPREAANFKPQKWAGSFPRFCSAPPVRVVLLKNYSKNIFDFATQISLRYAQHSAEQRSA